MADAFSRLQLDPEAVQDGKCRLPSEDYDRGCSYANKFTMADR
jgi:hypothetical protein